MNISQHFEDSDMKLEITPLIDVVFLLLIYFMVAASLVRTENDLNFILPADVPPTEMQEIPIEVLVQIMEDGTVQVEGMSFGPNDSKLDEFSEQVKGLKAIADSTGATFFVNIAPQKKAKHRRVVDVMDACHAANVKELTFSPAR